MDPASATVAFVGFAASLATLAGLLIQSVQTIDDLCHKLKRAPDDLKRFCDDLKRLELLLGLLKDRTSHYAEGDLPQELLLFWHDNASQMEKDYHNLDKLISKLQRCFDGYSVSKKHVTARVRMFFSCEEILEFNKRLSGHVGKFSLALSMINEYGSLNIHHKPCSWLTHGLLIVFEGNDRPKP
jgi:hypothetical protein